MTTRFDANASTNSIAQGNGAVARPTDVGFPLYVRMVVLEVIFDPYAIDEKKLEHWEHNLKVKNIKFGGVLPRNTIIGQRILDGSAPSVDPPMFLFPFFSSHFALPIKPGEHVWVMFEHPDARYTEMGYWMSRICDPGFIDDVNHTHSPRQFDKSFTPGNKDKFNGASDAVYEFRNGIVDKSEGQRYARGSTAFISGPETAYEDLMTNTDASKVHQYERVPRFRKRPGDLVLEGSNNALIVLGTDRAGTIADYDDSDTGKVPKFPEDDQQKDAGMIDIVAGRGATPDTGGEEVTSKRLSGAVFKKELEKSPAKIKPAEGDPDLKNDRSRIYIAAKTKVDEGLALDGYNSTFSIEDGADGDAGVVAKSDKVRIIARKDVEILVPGFFDGPDGVITEESDTSKWASIVLKANGDIILTPADKGVVKLGGEDARLAVLCAQAITGPEGSGVVTAAPIIDTMGGAHGANGATGEFAKKVLLK